MNKRAVILHGTSATAQSNWFPWLKGELEKLGFEVWAPNLPGAERPNGKIYNQFLLGQGWDFRDNIIIGHSSGAVEALNLLRALPNEVEVDSVYLVGVFKGNLGWEELQDVWTDSLNLQNIKHKAKRFVFFHSEDDPYCPPQGAREICTELEGEMHMFTDKKHFSYQLDPRFNELPELLNTIKDNPS